MGNKNETTAETRVELSYQREKNEDIVLELNLRGERLCLLTGRRILQLS